MRSIGGRVRSERTAKGLIQEKAASLVGVSGPFFCQVEKGDRAPSWQLLEAVCSWRGKPLEWLLFGEEGEEEGDVPELAVAEGQPYIRRNRAVRLPVTGRAAADAGSVVAFDAIDPPEWVEIPPGAQVIRVEGDSMVPVALDGQVAVFVPEPPESGGLGLVELKDGRQWFKRVWQFEDHWVLESMVVGEEPVVVRPKDVRMCRRWKATIAP